MSGLQVSDKGLTIMNCIGQGVLYLSQSQMLPEGARAQTQQPRMKSLMVTD